MKKQKKTAKKLSLNKETLTSLQQVVGGTIMAEQLSDGPEQCWFSECADCS